MSRNNNRGESVVRFPQMRSELLYAVSALADEDYQRHIWSGRSARDLGITYTFDMALHSLLDDSIVADQGQAAVGLVLKDDRELAVVERLVEAARELINEIGLLGTFEDARRSSAWHTVVTTAGQARSVLGDPPNFPTFS